MTRSYFERNYYLGQRIGSGNYGDVYMVIRRDSGVAYAVKTEPLHAHPQRLKHENKVYNHIHRRTEVIGIPKPTYFGRDRETSLLVMPLLGPSLADRRRECAGTLSQATLCKMGVQLLNIVEALHSRKFIHRDIKPQNILTSRGDGSQLSLIDFGFAEKFRNNRGHYPFREDGCFYGTINYASANAHRGLRLSRRDDLESLGYTLLSLRNGSLPWDKVHSRTYEDLHEKVLNLKTSLPLRRMCAGMPYMKGYFEMVSSLEYNEDPNYASLRAVFDAVLSTMQTNVETVQFDWEPTRSRRRANTGLGLDPRRRRRRANTGL